MQKIRGYAASMYGTSVVVHDAGLSSCLADVLRRVELRNVPFPLKFVTAGNALGVEMGVKDRETGEPRTITFWRVLPMLRSDDSLTPLVLQKFVWTLLMEAVEHEIAECFHVDGLRHYDPHADARDVNESRARPDANHYASANDRLVTEVALLDRARPICDT